MNEEMNQELEYKIEQLSMRVDELCVSQKNLRCVQIIGEIDESTASNVISSFLLFLQEDKKKPIVFFIDSIGGCAQSTISIVNIMENSPVPIYTVVSSRAMSAAVFITAAGTHGKRYAFGNSRFLTHEIRFTSSSGNNRPIQEHKSTTMEAEDIQSILNKMFIKHCNAKKDDIKLYFGPDDFYMNTIKAKEVGIIDHVIDKKTFKQILEVLL